MDPVTAPEVTVPAAEPVAPEAPKSLKEAGASAFERLSRTPEAPEPKAEDPKPADPAPEEVPDENGNGNGKVTEEVKKMLEEAIAKGEYIPKHRFDEVLQRGKAFEPFGTPEEIRAKLAELESLKKGNPPAKEEPSPEEELNEEDAAVKAHILKLFPWLKDVPKTQEGFEQLKKDHEARGKMEQEAQDHERTQLIESGTAKIKEFAEAEKLSMSPRALKAHIGAVTEILHEDQELSDRFYKGKDMTALKTAFDEYLKEVFSGYQRQAKVELLNGKKAKDALPKAPASGSAPVPEPEKPVKSLTQAADRAWDRLSQRKA